MNIGIFHRCLLLVPLFCGAGLFAKEATLDELLAVQDQVQSVLDQSRKAVVALECNGGTASGVIVSPEGLVLTAAHVTTAAGKKIKVTLPGGKTVEGDSLGLDLATDAAMVQLPAAVKGWPCAAINREVRALKLGDWCFALGHPGGWDKSRGSVLRVGRLVKISPNMLQSDCVLMGGDSGGALFNLAGEVIGINSQIWRGRDQNLHVSMAPFLRSWDVMKKGGLVKEWSLGNGAWIGISTQGAQDGLTVQAVAKDSPAMKAGLKDGDTILSLNNRKLATPAEFSEAIRARAADEIVTLKIRSGKSDRLVEVRLGRRPQE